MVIEFFVFQLEAILFSKFYEYVAKLDKGNFQTDLTVTIKVKNSRKSGLKLCKLILLVIKQTVTNFL